MKTQTANLVAFSDEIQGLLEKNHLNTKTILELTAEDLRRLGFSSEVITEIQITLFKNGRMLNGDENYYAEWSANL